MKGLRGLVALTVHCHHEPQASSVDKLQFVERCDICPVEVNKQKPQAQTKKKRNERQKLKRPLKTRRPAIGVEVEVEAGTGSFSAIEIYMEEPTKMSPC